MIRHIFAVAAITGCAFGAEPAATGAQPEKPKPVERMMGDQLVIRDGGKITAIPYEKMSDEQRRAHKVDDASIARYRAMRQVQIDQARAEKAKREAADERERAAKELRRAIWFVSYKQSQATDTGALCYIRDCKPAFPNAFSSDQERVKMQTIGGAEYNEQVFISGPTATDDRVYASFVIADGHYNYVTVNNAPRKIRKFRELDEATLKELGFREENLKEPASTPPPKQVQKQERLKGFPE